MSTTTLEIPNFAGLPDLCAEVMTAAVQSRSVEEPGLAAVEKAGLDPASPEAVKVRFEHYRSRMKSMLADMEARAQQAGVPQENVHQCKYALVALIDEVVLQSAWSFKDLWMGNPLQLELFNDFNAGDEFFKKLNNLRGDRDAEKLAVMEVYYHCLTMGFRGKYIDVDGMEQLKLLIDSVGRELVDARKYKAGMLSAHWERKDSLQDRVRNSPLWIIPVICAGGLLVFYLIYLAVLGIS